MFPGMRSNRDNKQGRLPLTTAETSAVLRVSPDTVCRYIDRGLLRATRIGRRWLIDEASVMRLLRHGTMVPEDLPP